MFIIGIIKRDRPEVLINPVTCQNENEVYNWLASFFSDENFKLDSPITQELVTQNLAERRPIRIAIAGYPVAVVFGEQSVIMETVTGVRNTDLFDLKDYMAQ